MKDKSSDKLTNFSIVEPKTPNEPAVIIIGSKNTLMDLSVSSPRKLEQMAKEILDEMDKQNRHY